MSKWTESPWFTPAIVVAIVGIAFTVISSRFTSIDAQYADTGKRLTDLDAKLDRRADGLLQSLRDTNIRIDTILQQQTTLAAQVGRVEAEMSYIRSRLDKIAEKLQVADAGPIVPAPTSPTVPVANLDGVFSKSQFEQLYMAIKQQPDPAFSSGFALTVGAKLPASVPIKELPIIVKEIRPSWEGLSYTVGAAGIAIVNPADKSVLTLVSAPSK
jgi:hypothetical protein